MIVYGIFKRVVFLFSGWISFKFSVLFFIINILVGVIDFDRIWFVINERLKFIRCYILRRGGSVLIIRE